MASALQTKILRRAKSPEDYAVYRAALEWGLTDPIVIESRDDFKSEYRWKDRLDPFHHQVQNLITFCRRLPVTLLADDVGLGKLPMQSPRSTTFMCERQPSEGALARMSMQEGS
jgi:hypothetical protein